MLNSPFFIVGFPRSGTTLLASLLGRHKDIYIPAETHFFRFYLSHTRALKCPDAEMERFCGYLRIKDLGLCASDLLAYREIIEKDRSALLAVALHVLAERNGKSIYGEKTPAHMLHLDEIQDRYPDAKFIAIVRDGRDCVLSNLREIWTRRNPYRLAAEWSFYNDRLRKFVKKHPARIYRVVYEDLIENAEDLIPDVIRFLGIAQDQSMLNRAVSEATVPVWERDWKSKALGLPDSHNKFKWKSDRRTQMISDISWLMRKDLVRNGYDYDGGGIDGRVLVKNLMFHPLPYRAARSSSITIRKVRRNVKGRLADMIKSRVSLGAF